MKAFLVLDELNQFHWAMLKSVLLILALLPIAEVSLKLWLSTEGSSQIMIGFFALSIVSAWLMVSFFTALKTSVWQTKQMVSKYEQLLFKAYRYVPMVFLSSLVAYLSLQLSIAF
ncbi:hypothetical protein ACT4VK_13450 [Acinetobacter baumannii]|uniref:Uncharacterized protein n=2 Tax=Gammaproteobacteria TaxID=1236 RepID=A0A3R9SHB9_ACIBA|nr:hypothetical protein [Acinetobacter baumannii]EHU3342639.1 hypothetical protein [Acinetobacter baumannii]ENV24681.1 hypothetical protein F962_03321 [Acinetobacter baumannii NIPH 190]EXE20249.1 putative membrane protein [Acinetobacter baumannii 1106579]EXE80944.1 putative membrane protein [Acinetobacter baumannii 83444]KRI48477.1 hypothetical protein APD18_07790 [Acinetobacter baumannii]